MNAIYAFGILILITLVAARFVFRSRSVVSPLQFFFSGGFIYILLGFVLGRSLHILTPEVLNGFLPLVTLGLGWVGFLFGFQLEKKNIKRFSQKYYILSLLQSSFVFFLVFAAVRPAAALLLPEISPHLLSGMAVAFAFLWTINSPSVIHAVSNSLPAGGKYYYIVRFLVSVNGFWGVLGLSLLASFWHYPFSGGEKIWNGVVLFFCTTLFSMGLGYVFHLLTKKKTAEQDILVYLLGLVFFVSGAAFYFNMPPLYTGMILGITFSNLTRIHEKLYPLLLSTEKPLYIIFLILIGALWDFRMTLPVAVLTGLLVILRPLAYILPLPLIERTVRFPDRLGPRFGLCFLSSGGLGIAFAVSIKMAFPASLADTTLSVALLAVIIVELISPFAARSALRELDKG